MGRLVQITIPIHLQIAFMGLLRLSKVLPSDFWDDFE
jgi:hypothetical protein